MTLYLAHRAKTQLKTILSVATAHSKKIYKVQSWDWQLIKSDGITIIPPIKDTGYYANVFNQTINQLNTTRSIN